MGTKSVTGVVVSSTETEIIESTRTDASVEKSFNVDNGDNEIIAKAWGSENGIDWSVVDTKTIAPRENGILIIGPNHFIDVKLTGITTSQFATSSVDATLTW
jgi:hypothetical protein